MAILNLPINATTFAESVKAECKQLIELGLWDVRMARFESWIKQFCGNEEEFFSACLLDQIILRTTQQFEAGLRSLLRSNLNSNLFSGAPDLELSQKLASRNDPKLRLVPVICETDPPTKSGPLVLRRLQRSLQFNQQWMCWPWQAPDHIRAGTEIIIFVDDFLGSGRQFVKFFNQWKFHEFSEGVRYFYAPVVAHQQGIIHLKNELPAICVTSAETLGESHGFFSAEVWSRLGQGNISAEEAKAWYLDFANQRGFSPKSIGPLGVGDLALTFGFSHSTPNNSLPILWYETSGWQPLLER